MTRKHKKKVKYPLRVTKVRQLEDEVLALREIVKQCVEGMEFFNGLGFKLIDMGVITNEQVYAKITEQRQAAAIKAQHQQRQTDSQDIGIQPERPGNDADSDRDGGQSVLETESDGVDSSGS